MGADLPGLLARLAPHGGLPWPVRHLVRRAFGFEQVLTTRAAVTELLDREDVTVPYAERSAPLGLDRFPLALDGEDHRVARGAVERAIGASAAAHRRGLSAAADDAAGRVRAAGWRLDVVQHVLEPVLHRWAEHWFGLPGAGPRLLESGQLILHATFLNPALPTGEVDLPGLRWAVDHVHEHRRALVEVVADAPSGSLAASVLHETGDGDEGRDLAARHLLGLTVGPLALVHRAVADVVDLLLARPWELDAATDEDQARRTFVAALRHRPPLPGVLRQVPEDTDVYSGTQLVDVPKGLVLAATACPARLGEANGPELAFGHGVHRCMGEQHTTDVATVVLQALAPRRPRRAPGPGGRLRRAPAPSGVDEWDVPGHLEVALR